MIKNWWYGHVVGVQVPVAAKVLRACELRGDLQRERRSSVWIAWALGCLHRLRGGFWKGCLVCDPLHHRSVCRLSGSFGFHVERTTERLSPGRGCEVTGE